MDKVKICLKTQKHEVTMLNIVEMTESDGILTITLSGNSGVLSVSDIVTFSRNILNEDGNYQVVDTYSTRVLNVKEDGRGTTEFTITAPENHMVQVVNITSGDGYYKIDCASNHNIFPQDLMILNEEECLYYEDTLKEDSGNVCTIKDVRLHEYNSYFLDDVVEPKYCLFDIRMVDSYNCNDDPTVFELSPNFYYKRNDVDRNSFFVTDILVDDIDKLYKGIYLPYNLFYYKDGNNCIIWNNYEGYDEVASTIQTIQDYQAVYNSAETKVSSEVKFYEDNSEYKISFGLSQNVDYKHLYQEQNITTLFAEKVKESVVENAPIIDMEKVKFSPYMDGTVKESASAISFNLHFRTRTDLEESWRYTNDGDYWNKDYCIVGEDEHGEPIYETYGIENYGDIRNHVKPKADGGWINNGDMLYYLGFTDEDVKNQKSKIKKSFIRLSFYDDTNPLTQKLLYYSTIFMDSGELFGKYVKAKSELRNKGKDVDNVVLDSYQTKHRVDCKFVVRDEFYTEKSSEGFNIYYFPDEIEELAKENRGKTIYMKVEFNHAGFGRTIPMIACYDQTNMSISKYKERLYIKLELKYINGKYVYYVTDNDSGIIKQDATIEFNLFEPVIDAK